MQKSSMLFLIILAMIVILAAYEATIPLPASSVFVRYFALVAFGLICLSLMIGPLVVFQPHKFAHIMEPRRAIGIAAFIFALAHFGLVFALEYGWDIGITIEAAKLGIMMVGIAGLLFIIAITSNDYSMKKLGPGLWKNIQRLNYLIFIVSFAHFILSAKGLFVGSFDSLNLAEAAMVLLGIVTIILQVAGVLKMRKNLAEQKAKKEILSKETQETI